MGSESARMETTGKTRNQKETELVTHNVDELSNAILSTMKVELMFKCEGLPASFFNVNKPILSYKVEYGGSQHVIKWSEKLARNAKPKFSNSHVIPYEMGTNKLMKIFLYRHEEEKKILYGEANIDLNEAIIARNNEVRRKIKAIEEIYKEEESYVTLKVNEKKQEADVQLSIQFEVIDCKLKGPLYYTCSQKIEEASKFISQSEMVTINKSEPQIFTFHPLILSSENFEGQWEDGTVTFRFENARKRQAKVPMQSTATYTTRIKDLIQMQNKELNVEIRDSKFGRVIIKNKKFERVLTLGSILFGGTKFVPIIAVDCSLGNLTFDNLTCMHHFDKTKPNYYIEALKVIESRITPFYSKLFAYGFGANVNPKKEKASNCFSLTGNIFNPAVENKEELIESYMKTIKSVTLSLPVNFSEVIKTAKELAQIELQYFKTNKLNNYYILYILTPGVLDDSEETFNECLDIPELPLSIIFIKLTNKQKEETKDVDDLDELKKRLEQYQTQKRKFMSYVEFDRIYNDLENFGKFLISTVPTQVLQFLKTHAVGDEEMNGGGVFEEEKVIGAQSSCEEYFERLKSDYYRLLQAKGVSASNIEQILKRKVPDLDPDYALEFLKLDKEVK